MIKLISDLRQVGGFLLLKVVLNTIKHHMHFKLENHNCQKNCTGMLIKQSIKII